MPNREQPEKSHLKINDRRRFSPDGSPREDAEELESRPAPSPLQTPTQAKSENTPTPQTPPPPQPPETDPHMQKFADLKDEGDLPADFNALLISLASSAQLALGLSADPQTKGVANLPQAKHIIDLLGMLEEKTRNNLSAEEARLLKTLLYELRMIYLQVA